MAFYSFPITSLIKKGKVKKCNNLPSNFKTDFYKNWLENIDSSVDSDFQRKTVSEAPSKDVKNYLLTTMEYRKQIQESIDLYITRDRLNEVSCRK